ncbi:hypothetical protein QJS04_geneDACA006986 [Acorus gramineus]|uniref:Uncharacterized protein n=1 Tax=Acorus gramineus TaxID=55184 RepID=A0AAV9A2K1_ACOGR|nr:hypothetical protein QJS04_geneDACA006986 [Acorus gramineus]
MRWVPPGASCLRRLAQFREAFRALKEEGMTWRPYKEEEVPEELSRDIWLIFFNEVVYHAISRVVRQLGYFQWVPAGSALRFQWPAFLGIQTSRGTMLCICGNGSRGGLWLSAAPT